MSQRLLAIVRKEFTQTVRDWRTLTVVFALPVVLLLLFGYAVEMQVQHIPTVVVDNSLDSQSLSLVEAMETSGFFDVAYYVQSESEAIRRIDEGLARAAIVIPADFAASLARGEAQALVVVDGSDAMTVQSAFNAAIAIGEAHAVNLMTEKLQRSGQQASRASLIPLDVRTRVLYNPDMRSIVFMVPGIAGLILQYQTVMLTALAIVRERELGTIEQLLVTPIRAWELMLGKILPMVILAVLNMGTVLALGVLWFGVPFKGSLGLFALMALLFMFSSLGLGILISTVSANQRQAQQLTMLVNMPSMMLSGYIFPRSEMPVLIQRIGDLLPLSHFLVIARGIITKGVGLYFFRQQAWALGVDNVDLTVRPGETFGLLGADGAGKTTTLRLLTGLLLPDSGTARVAGFDTVKQVRQIHLLSGYMPQQFALYGDLTVLENLRFFCDARGLSASQRRERIPRLLGFARLDQFRGRLASQLSGGMQKKLALACMLIHEPQIVFLDEPTLGVDPVSRREFWNLLSDLRAEQRLTVFVCTPYMDEAERCNRVGLLYQGRLIACDTPQGIKQMVSGELVELRPSNLQAGRDALSGLPGVLEVQTFGDMLHVFVDGAQLRIGEMRASLEDKGLTVTNVRRIEPRMEEAFISLIRRESREVGRQGDNQ